MLQNAEVIIGNLSLEQLKYCDSLKWLQLSSVGANEYVDFPKDFILANVSGVYGTVISEYTIVINYKHIVI